MTNKVTLQSPYSLVSIYNQAGKQTMTIHTILEEKQWNLSERPEEEADKVSRK